ncbi:MAG: anthranilate phosphoribosyltransferase [Pseudomonadota bacterium]
MIKEAIQKVVTGNNLTEQEMISIMKEIMEGNATDAQIGSFITALRMKGETVDEITGAARVMREKATVIHATGKIVVDTCGTGGDGSNTFNVSTATAFVAAGGGISVAKHGNRSVSSQCGSADVLVALGVNIDVPPQTVEECINEIGIGFLFAPKLHAAMKYAIGPRREIGIRTIFNILGPLTNPAKANVQVLGVYDSVLTHTIAETLKNLGSKSAWVVHGEGGLDEISILGPTLVSELRNGEVKILKITPEEVGLTRGTLADIRGGDAKQNAAIILDILKGHKSAKRDIVLFNAAATFRAADMAEDLKQGIALAEESIDSGKAFKKLELLIKKTNS